MHTYMYMLWRFVFIVLLPCIAGEYISCYYVWYGLALSSFVIELLCSNTSRETSCSPGSQPHLVPVLGTGRTMHSD